MKIIHISYGGPDRQIRDADGKAWKFEMDRRGEPADKQPGSRAPVGVAGQHWANHGALNRPARVCHRAPAPAPPLVHLGGRQYAIAGSALAKKH